MVQDQIPQENKRTEKERSVYIQMIYWGINALNHGSSMAVFNSYGLVDYQSFATDTLPSDAFKTALDNGIPERIFWYEKPWTKKLRQAKAGQWSRVVDLDDLPRRYLNEQSFNWCPITYTPHHASHAAAGYYTSSFDDAAVVVLDAIGEFDCASIWHGKGRELTKVWSATYPNSLGLFYSAFTDLLGFKPIAEEYKLQQLAEYGDPEKYYKDVKEYMGSVVRAHKNMHKGITDWPHVITDADRAHIAAAVQEIFEEQVDMVMRKAKRMTGSSNLVYMGGCAMNDRANRYIRHLWDNVWSLKNPGDPSSAIGAVLYHTKQRITTETQGFRL